MQQHCSCVLLNTAFGSDLHFKSVMYLLETYSKQAIDKTEKCDLALAAFCSVMTRLLIC